MLFWELKIAKEKDCFHNAPWSITSKLHAVCEQNWVQIERIKKTPPRSRPGMSKCAKSQPEPLAIDEAPSSTGLRWKAP